MLDLEKDVADEEDVDYEEEEEEDDEDDEEEEEEEELRMLTWDHFLNQEENFCPKFGKNMSLSVLMV